MNAHRTLLRRLPRPLALLLLVLIVATVSETALRVAGGLYLRKLYTTAYQAEHPRPGDVNIVCLGESSTAGLWVDPEDSYPKQLEALLRDSYDSQKIRVIVPPHVGQNTSQMANRIREYIDLYQPRLILVMAGYNNEWSLAESHLPRFLGASDPQARKAKALAFLDGFRLFKLFRYGYLRLFGRDGSEYLEQNRNYVWGHPELVHYPPAGWVYSFTQTHRSAVVESWRSDVRGIIREAKRSGVAVLLMTYHINPTYLPAEEFLALAREEAIPCVRNDEAFEILGRNGTLDRFVSPEDRWHPNRAGYALIARNAFRRIRDEDLLRLGPEGGPRHVPAAFPRLEGSIVFGTKEADKYLGAGWSRPERGSESAWRWTDGPRADVFFRHESSEARVLRMRLDPFIVPGRWPRQRVRVEINGQPAARLWLEQPETRTYSVVIPDTVAEADKVLTLYLPDAASPARLGTGDDLRRLAMALEWLKVEDFPPWPPSRRVDLGREDAQTYLGPGWSETAWSEEGLFRWMHAPRAEVFFRAGTGSFRALRLRINAAHLPDPVAGQPLAIDLNGERVSTLRLTMMDPLPAVYTVELPADLVRSLNVLTFELSATEASDPSRRAELAVAWIELAVAGTP